MSSSSLKFCTWRERLLDCRSGLGEGGRLAAGVLAAAGVLDLAGGGGFGFEASKGLGLICLLRGATIRAESGSSE